MTDCTTSPAASARPTGSSKAERLRELTRPFGPEFPLDEDLRAELDPYEGEEPTSAEHYVELLYPR